MSDEYNRPTKPGDHTVICDRSGLKSLRSECVKEWNGLLVRKEFAEKRHPLDHPPPVQRDRPVKDARPEKVYFLDFGDVTEDDL